MNIRRKFLSCGLTVFVVLKDISSSIWHPKSACDRIPYEVGGINRFRKGRSPRVRDHFEIRRAQAKKTRDISTEGHEAQAIFAIKAVEFTAIVCIRKRHSVGTSN